MAEQPEQQDGLAPVEQLRVLEALRDVNRAARPYRFPHSPGERYLRVLSEAARRYHIDCGREYLRAVSGNDGSIQGRRRLAAAVRAKEQAEEQRLRHGWAYESMVADWLCEESPHHRDRIAARIAMMTAPSAQLVQPLRQVRL
ncbi:hypothetical protein [Streptomyces albiaxialis]